MIYLISHRSTNNNMILFSFKDPQFSSNRCLIRISMNIRQLKKQHILLSPCSLTFMPSNNLGYLMLRSGNNQIIMNIPCMYRTCPLTSDTTPVVYKHCICKQNRISKFSRLTIRARWRSRDKISMSRLLVLSTMLDRPFVPKTILSAPTQYMRREPLMVSVLN